MNDLKRRRIIRDWTIYGATAYIFYAEVVLTQDVDIFILTETEQDVSLPEYRRVLQAIQEYTAISQADAATFLAEGRRFQVFQARGHPFWEDVVQMAVWDTVAGEPVRVASREHLILLALLRFDRGKDWPRIFQLYQQADKLKLGSLLRRFDSDGTLRGRLEQLRPWIEG